MMAITWPTAVMVNSRTYILIAFCFQLLTAIYSASLRVQLTSVGTDPTWQRTLTRKNISNKLNAILIHFDGKIVGCNIVSAWDGWLLTTTKVRLMTLHKYGLTPPGQNGRHFADDIFKCIFLNGNVWMSLKISLKFVPGVQINNIPVLVQIMAWCRQGDKP